MNPSISRFGPNGTRSIGEASDSEAAQVTYDVVITHGIVKVHVDSLAHREREAKKSLNTVKRSIVRQMARAFKREAEAPLQGER